MALVEEEEVEVEVLAGVGSTEALMKVAKRMVFSQKLRVIYLLLW